jgi:hypothetical protein
MSNVQELTDRLEITDLVTRLGHWLDGRGGDPSTIYDRDIVARSPRGEFHGFDEVLAFVTRDDPSGERYQHFHTDVLVHLDGDRAEVTANQLTNFFQPGEAPHRSSGLRLRYEAIRRPDGWRIAVADIELAWLVGTFPTT